MLYFSILVPLPAECSGSVPSCNVSFAYAFTKNSSVSQLPTAVDGAYYIENLIICKIHKRNS